MITLKSILLDSAGSGNAYLYQRQGIGKLTAKAFLVCGIGTGLDKLKPVQVIHCRVAGCWHKLRSGEMRVWDERYGFHIRDIRLSLITGINCRRDSNDSETPMFGEIHTKIQTYNKDFQVYYPSYFFPISTTVSRPIRTLIVCNKCLQDSKTSLEHVDKCTHYCLSLFFHSHGVSY